MPPSPLDIEKEQLRQQMKLLRAAVSPEQRAEAGIFFAEQLMELLRRRDVKTLHSYLPIGHEPDTWPLVHRALAEGIRIVVPKTEAARQLSHWELVSTDQLVPGRFGTLFPADGRPFSASPDLIVVPGLAFDAEGGRLGYGGGYYDTFLAQQPTAYRLALAYPFQLLPKVPAEPHDQPVHQVVVAPI